MNDIDTFLETTDGKKVCKLAGAIVGLASIIIGLKVIGKALIESNFGDGSGELTNEERIVYGAIFVGGVFYVFCNTKKTKSRV
jgi:hypothetical protein